MKAAVSESASLIAAAVQDETIGAVSELIQETARKLEERPRVLGVSSETWYVYRMADDASWRRANGFLSEDLSRGIPLAYSQQQGSSGAAPFIVSVHPDPEGVTCAFRKAPRSRGLVVDQCRDATIDAIRSSIKRYVRMAASGQQVEG